MTPDHPLRPLVLALSHRLNFPGDLLAEIEALRLDYQGEAGLLAGRSRQGAVCLARAAIGFNGSPDVVAHADTDAFRGGIMNAGLHLMLVGTMAWPEFMDADDLQGEYRFRRACLDTATGCYAMAAGSLPRPDTPLLQTNLGKAIPLGLRHGGWTYATLPDYGAERPLSPAAAPTR